MLNFFGTIWLVSALAGVAYCILLLLQRHKQYRVIALRVGVFSIVVNPFSARGAIEWSRPSGPVTLENWKRHKALHEAAGFADAVDHAPRSFTLQTRTLVCRADPKKREKSVKTDSKGRLRYYSTAQGEWGAVRLGLLVL